MNKELIPNDYKETLDLIKNKILVAQQKASLSVNMEMLLLYWGIGKTILDRIENQGWGTKVIDELSKDLKLTYPNMQGFSSRNLRCMRQFAKNYSDTSIWQLVVAKL